METKDKEVNEEKGNVLKRFLSELSSVLVHEDKSISGKEEILSPDGLYEEDTKTDSYDFSQAAFDRIGSISQTKSKKRKLRIAEDVAINPDNSSNGNQEYDGPENFEDNADVQLFVQESSDVDQNEEPIEVKGQGITDVVLETMPGSIPRFLQDRKKTFSLQHLRHITESLLKESTSDKRFTLPLASQNELRRIIDHFIEILSNTLLRLMNNGETENLDRCTIIKVFHIFGTVNLSTTTNQNIFEICSRYLSSEKLNDLEIQLFS